MFQFCDPRCRHSQSLFRGRVGPNLNCAGILDRVVDSGLLRGCFGQALLGARELARVFLGIPGQLLDLGLEFGDAKIEILGSLLEIGRGVGRGLCLRFVPGFEGGGCRGGVGLLEGDDFRGTEFVDADLDGLRTSTQKPADESGFQSLFQCGAETELFPGTQSLDDVSDELVGGFFGGFRSCRLEDGKRRCPRSRHDLVVGGSEYPLQDPGSDLAGDEIFNTPAKDLAEPESDGRGRRAGRHRRAECDLALLLI